MDVTTKAVVLRATDYKENDKLVLLYSLEYGKISVHARGVRKSAARLKFACDQFCFGQYELVRSADRFTLKTCDQLESFFCLREDIFTYYSACCAAECLVNCTEEGQSDPKLFVTFLKALQQLSDSVEPLLVTQKFLSDFLGQSGVRTDFSHCSVCGAQASKMWLDPSRGAVCSACRRTDSFFVSSDVISLCRLLDKTSYEQLKTLSVPDSVLKGALEVLRKYFSAAFLPPKSLSELLRLV